MNERYEMLQRKLLENPEQFESRGEGNAMLKEHFNGVPVELLRPLLQHDNHSVRGTAMFVVNELGATATALIDDVIPLIKDTDVHIQWDALESVMVCSIGEYAEKFVFVIRELENSNSSICRLAMRLIVNASRSQIEAGIRNADKFQRDQAVHMKGLGVLLNWSDVGNVEVIDMLNHSDDLVKKYGAIIAKRRLFQSPELIQHATKSENDVVSRFAKESLEENPTDRQAIGVVP